MKPQKNTYWIASTCAFVLGLIAWAYFDDDASGRTHDAHMAAMPEMELLGSQKIGLTAYYFYEFTADGEYCIFVKASSIHGIGLSCREVK